jgi:hypothetical protein
MYASDKGLLKCTNCPIDTYLPAFGKSSKADCIGCSIDRSTGITVSNTNKASCVCKRNEYYTTADGSCQPCPTGADCSFKDGMVLTELTAQPGYWRPSTTVEIFSPCVAGYSSLNGQRLADARCCPLDIITNISICARNIMANSSKSSSSTTNITVNLDDQCADGFAGPLCIVCATGFVKQGQSCMACPQGASIVAASVPLLSMLLLLLVVLLIVFRCCKKSNEKKIKNKWFGQAKVCVFIS